jgi:hypothetical protein
MSRRVNPRPIQMFFYCNPMATKRSDKNQLNIRLEDELSNKLDVLVELKRQEIIDKLGEGHRAYAINYWSRVRVAGEFIKEKLAEIQVETDPIEVVANDDSY